MTHLHIQLPCPMCFSLIIYLLGKVICDKLLAGGNKLVNAELIQSSHVHPLLAQMFCRRFRDSFAGPQPLRWITCMFARKNGNCTFVLVLLVICFFLASTRLHRASPKHGASMYLFWEQYYLQHRSWLALGHSRGVETRWW